MKSHKVRTPFLATLLCALGLTAAGACSGSTPRLSQPSAPPTDYQRRIVVVLERPDYRPVAGAEIKVEVQSPTVLLEPAEGRGLSDSQGALTLVFVPKAHYDEKVMAGDDIVVDFPVKAILTVTEPGRPPKEFSLDDRESFARYADPLYQGLNRDPEQGEDYYQITLP